MGQHRCRTVLQTLDIRQWGPVFPQRQEANEGSPTTVQVNAWRKLARGSAVREHAERGVHLELKRWSWESGGANMARFPGKRTKEERPAQRKLCGEPQRDTSWIFNKKYVHQLSLQKELLEGNKKDSHQITHRAGICLPEQLEWEMSLSTEHQVDYSAWRILLHWCGKISPQLNAAVSCVTHPEGSNLFLINLGKFQNKAKKYL